MGTCAGCVLLSKEGDDQVERTGTELLKLMDMAVDRNAFGRQRESFEVLLTSRVSFTGFPAVFIRAPLITRCGVQVRAAGGVFFRHRHGETG